MNFHMSFYMITPHSFIAYCQAQLSSLKPQLKLSFSFIPSFSPPPPHHHHHPGKSSKLNCRPVRVDSKQELSQAFSSSHSWLSRQPQLVFS